MFYLGQEVFGGDGCGLWVEQMCEDFVVEDVLGVQVVYYWLEIEQQVVFCQGLVDLVVLVLVIVECCECGVVLVCLGLGGLVFGLGQGLVGMGQEICG